jgi:hypothetical protein
MWCAIQVTGDDGQPLWLSNPDLKGRRSVSSFEDGCAVFWRPEHAEAAIGSYMCQKGAKTSGICVVDVSDKILGAVPTS